MSILRLKNSQTLKIQWIIKKKKKKQKRTHSLIFLIKFALVCRLC